MSDRTIGHYRVLERLGQGGMGEVYLAEDQNLQRKVALKLLAPELARDGEALKRFEQEALAAAELSHPNIATIHDFGRDSDEPGGPPYLVLEYVPGETLAARVQHGPLPLDLVLGVGGAMAEALAHAHERGVVHRDVKSANVMLGQKNAVKVLDFGLALREDATRVTREGARVGTVGYMSPEQLRGEDLDHRTDIWSLGVVLYETLVGKMPFASLQSILAQEPEPITAQRTGVPMELERVVQKCLAKDRADRYQHAEEIAVDLRRLGSKSGASSNVASRPTRRASAWRITGGALAVVAVVVAAILMLRPPDSLPFSARDWIVIADFENSTDDADFDLSLKNAFEVSLGQSQFVNIFPRNRIAETLQRMEREVGSTLNEDIAREVAQREAIKLVVVCSITRVAGEFLLASRILDARSGVALRTASARADGKGEVLDALEDLSGSVRRDLGESLAAIDEERVPLPKATTASFDALRDFALGQMASGDREFEEALRYFESAISYDPDFAMAHASLGQAFAWRGDRTKAEVHFQRALQLEDRLTARERLRIRPHVEAWRGNHEDAIAGFQRYLDEYPDDSDVWHDIGYRYMLTRRCDEAFEAFTKVLTLNPNAVSAHINIATCFIKMGSLEEALLHYEKGFAIRPEWRTSTNLNHEFGFVFVRLGRLEEAEANFRTMLDGDAYQRANGLRSLGLLAMYQGHYHEAIDLFQQLVRLNQTSTRPLTEARNRLHLASVHRRMGNSPADAEQRRAVAAIFASEFYGCYWSMWAGVSAARAGDLDQAEGHLAAIESGMNPDTREDHAALLRVRGEIELARGDHEKALESLELAWSKSGQPFSHLGAVARANQALGRLEKARAQFEEFVQESELGWEIQESWFEAHYWLGRIHEDRGEPAAALRWYERLAQLWESADADFPLRTELLERLDRLRTSRAG